MPERALSINRWDRAGMIASSACAVHCTLLPLVAAALPLFGLRTLLDGRVEWMMLGVTALIGLAGHIRAFRRDHRHVAPGLIFAAGFLLVCATRLLFEGHWAGPIPAGAGGLLAAASHWANVRLCRCCTDCAPSAEAALRLPAPGLPSSSID